MAMYYAIHATAVNTRDGWTSARALPIFYLHKAVQGILDARQAEDVAERLLSDANFNDSGVTFAVRAYFVG